MLKINSKAPNFSLPDQNGRNHGLSDYKGKWLVLYFYPKDDTPGCTKEACGFRDGMEKYEKYNVSVLGVSKDSQPSHSKFAQKYNLNFPILSDTDLKVIKVYDAWGMKKFMGREFEGVKRVTTVIDPKGLVVKFYKKVNPLNHAEEILSFIGEKI